MSRRRRQSVLVPPTTGERPPRRVVQVVILESALSPFPGLRGSFRHLHGIAPSPTRLPADRLNAILAP